MRGFRRLGLVGALPTFVVFAAFVVWSHLPPPNPSLRWLATHRILIASHLHAQEPITMVEAERLVRSDGGCPPPVETASISAELLRLRSRYLVAPVLPGPVWLVTWTGTCPGPVVCVAPQCVSLERVAARHANVVLSAASGKILFFFASP